MRLVVGKKFIFIVPPIMQGGREKEKRLATGKEKGEPGKGEHCLMEKGLHLLIRVFWAKWRGERVVKWKMGLSSHDQRGVPPGRGVGCHCIQGDCKVTSREGRPF